MTEKIYGFKRLFQFLFLGLMSLFLAGCSSNSVASQSDQIKGYPISSDVQTTAQRTVMLGTSFTGTIIPQNLEQISLYDQYGYGAWSYGPGLDHEKRTDIMPNNYSYTSVTKETKLLNFFTISDIHITDKEAPNQLIYLQQLNSKDAVVTSVYSPVMLYTTFVLDAAIQTINALHKKKSV